jgi:hypothetical protein
LAPGIYDILNDEKALAGFCNEKLKEFLSGEDALKKYALSLLITKELMQRFPNLKEPIL